MKIFITGSAGFIGYHITKLILQKTNYQVIGIDNLDDYYDVNLKISRLSDTGISDNCKTWNSKIQSKKFSSYHFIRMNLEDKENIFKLFKKESFDMVLHFAAQAGVRYSLQNPYAYINSNILGFMNILEACKRNPVKLLLFSSSSSIYGNSKEFPYKENQQVDNPISLYAATKKSNELIAYTYHHLFKIPTIGLRFFTVYGPWGRPDMAYYKFTKNILNDKPIEVYNNGNAFRDFTYIDDVGIGVLKILRKNINNKVNTSLFNIYNLGNTTTINLLDFIAIIENCIGKKAILQLCEAQPGDVFKTHADISKLNKDYGFSPSISLKEGIKKFVKWYKDYTLKSS